MAHMNRDIRFCTTSDGVRIAYEVSGRPDAPPLVAITGWVSHLDFDREMVTLRGHPLLREHLRVVAYDERGTGLSIAASRTSRSMPACAIWKLSLAP